MIRLLVLMSRGGSGVRRPIGLLFGLLLAATHPACASVSNVVANGSFEQGTAGWILFGQANGTVFAQTNNALDGTNALVAGNRTNLTYHVAQTITSNLLAEGTGVYFGVEFSVFLDVPAHARMTLQVTDSGGGTTLILAEKMIASDTGRWVTVRGGRVVNWQGTLSSASLRFEIGQITERVYPSAILDRIAIVRDTDRDGITDDTDASPADADANANGIPDGWESHYQLPSAAGSSDNDGDGYSNIEEYWAATHPTNALSKPAQPANTNATAEARAFLAYLAALPTRLTNRVLVGQVVTDTPVDFSNQVATLHQQTGRWPSLLGVVYDMINGPISHPVITPYATNWWNAGGVVHVQWNPDNPWNGFFSGNTNNIDFPALFTPGSPSHTNYIAMMDEVATGLRQLGDAGMTVLFRPLNECNSNNNWFQRRHRDDYLALYRWTFDYLAKSQALNHVLWVYDALDGPHQQVPVYYYYPGDDVVDVFGVNLYDDDWVPAFDLDRLSRDYPKPLAIPEGGPLAILNRSFTNLTYINAISNNFPRLSYFEIYNSFPSGSTTKHYSLVHNIGASNLFDHPWIVTREELDWRAMIGPFGVWQLGAFTTNANNPQVAGPGADPDHDGAPNLYEYATATDPQADSAPGLGVIDQGFFFGINPFATDLVYQTESSTNLADAAWSVTAVRPAGGGWSAGPGFSITDHGGGVLSLHDLSGVPDQFFRLRVSQP